MGLTKNLSLVFKSVPTGLPVPGRDLVVEDRPIDLEIVPHDGFITRNLFHSLDPYMRLMLISPDTEHYRKPYDLHRAIRSLGVAEVIRSSNPKYPTGSIIRTNLPIQQYSILSLGDIEARASNSSSAALKVLPAAPTDHHLAYWLGPLGMPGLTAYSSIFEIGRPKEGETIFISSAAGAVGQIVGQICKMQGLRVIGSAGSSAKCSILKDILGFDAAFNYKQVDTSVALRRLAPEGVDIYYDNVGGRTLEDALRHMAPYGRVVICGMVSQYNSSSPDNTAEGGYGVKTLFELVSKGLTMRGFQVGMDDFGPKYSEEFEEKMKDWITSGKIKPCMSEIDGIELSAKGFVGMLSGQNTGKAILRVARTEKDGSVDSVSEALFTPIN